MIWIDLKPFSYVVNGVEAKWHDNEMRSPTPYHPTDCPFIFKLGVLAFKLVRVDMKVRAPTHLSPSW